jgi:hypothetical protein
MEKSGSLVASGEFRKVEQALAQWRARRRGNERIPEALWQAAVELARVYGVGPVSVRLKLGHTDLKQRLAQSKSVKSSVEPPSSLTFVALPLANQPEVELPAEPPPPPATPPSAPTIPPQPPVERPVPSAKVLQGNGFPTPLEHNGNNSTGSSTPFELELKGADGAEFRLRMPVEAVHSWSTFPLLELVSGFWSRTRT